MYGLSATSQNITEESLGTSSQIVIPPIFYQAFYINSGTGVSVNAKIYYNCNKDEPLNEETAVDYDDININSSTSTAEINLDREITQEKPDGTRAIKLTITDSGFVNGTTYTFYYDVIKGDANNDETIDSMDAYLTLDLVESGTAISNEQLGTLDMNEDGEFNKADAYLVLEKAVQ